MSQAQLQTLMVQRTLRTSRRVAAVSDGGVDASGDADQNGPEAKRIWPGHPIDLRASVPLPGGRWYVTILAGRERRSFDRLRAEGQLAWVQRAAIYMMLLALILWIIVCVVAVFYFAKSALGVDFFDGSSPLHFIYERVFESAIWPAISWPAASIALMMLE